MKILLDSPRQFNLDLTLCCGQAFRWEKHGEWWYGVVRDKVLRIRQNGEELQSENAEADFVRDYFGLTDDLPTILREISRDSYMKSVIHELKGLRILRQDPWECLISYICATYKNISAIKQMLLNLAKKFGRKIQFRDHCFYTFPTESKLAEASTAELASCGLGYRTAYVSEAARMVHGNGFGLQQLRNTDYKEARAELQKLPGVGLKVADCILLFSLGKLEAFPVDVWIRRTITKHYARHFPTKFINKISTGRSLSNSEYKKLSSFGREHFGRYAGYAQEYLYHYERPKL
jgi:N-glycosylase/DNA lyase